MSWVYDNQDETYIATQILADLARVASAICLLVFTPYIAVEFGKNKENISLNMMKKVKVTQIAFCILGLIAISFVFLFADILINTFAPAYTDATATFITRTMGIGIGFASLPCLIFLSVVGRVWTANYIIGASALGGFLAFLCLNAFISLESALISGFIVANILSFISASAYVFRSSFAPNNV